MVDEKELEEFVKDDLKKAINQEDKIDESVGDHINEMGWLWDRVQQKLSGDSVCFVTKKKIDTSKGEKMHLLESTSTEPGCIAFCAVSDEGMKELTEKENEGKEQ